MKERKGPFGVMVGGLVDSVVQTARRRAQDREPRALIYDAAGRPRVLGPSDSARDDLVETAGRLIDMVGAAAREAAEAEEEAAAAEAGAAEQEAAAATADAPVEAEPGDSGDRAPEPGP